MDTAIRFPSVAHLRDQAKKRIPHFAWEYLDSGEGAEATLDDNVAALQRITLTPRFMKGCLLYTSPSPRDQRGSRMPSSA